jgi:hypothetical protein
MERICEFLKEMGKKQTGWIELNYLFSHLFVNRLVTEERKKNLIPCLRKKISEEL